MSRLNFFKSNSLMLDLSNNVGIQNGRKKIYKKKLYPNSEDTILFEPAVQEESRRGARRGQMGLRITVGSAETVRTLEILEAGSGR